FGLGLLLLADRRRNPDIRWGALTATLAVISLSFSTVSVPLVMVAAVLLWARQGVRVAIAVFAPSGVVFAAWYQFIGREVLSQGAGSAQITPDTLRNLPEFAWRGLSHAIGEPLQLDGFFGGIILVLVLVVTLTVFLRSVRGPALIAIAAAGGAVAFFSLTAVARANLGPTASRYLYVGGAMLFPLAAVALSRLWSRGTVAVIVVVIVLFSLIVLNARDLRRVALAEAVIVQNLRRELLAVAQVVRDQPDVPGRVVPQLQVNPDLTVARLRSLMRSGWFPSERVDPAAFPEVQWYPHITLSNRPELPLGSDAPTVGSGAQSSEVVDGCSVVAQAPEGRITLSAVAPSSVRVTAPVATAMQIRDAGPSGEDRGMVATRELHPERPVYVNLQRRGAIAIAPYYGTFTVCGLAPAVPGP
ncbi:MAG TPA: hypothetical protein VFF40_12320, partial [Acidimicrobiia bacterium]|nr:hypothetical protein [Acidimicrobiia bacterium]